MVGSERREPDVLAEGLRDRRPVIGKGDPGLARPVRREVIAPGPAAEAQAAVAGVVARLPGDGAGRVEHLHPAGHLVGPVRVVFVVHGNAEDLSGRGQRRAVERLADPAGAVDRGVPGWVGKYCEDDFRGASMIVVALTLSSAMSSPPHGLSLFTGSDGGEARNSLQASTPRPRA